MAIDSPDITRHLPFDALFNVRDLGGYGGHDGRSVRWNRVYRADDLGGATRGDLATLADLGIRTIIDLRTVNEVAGSSLPNLPGSYVDHHHLPLLAQTWAALGACPRDGVDPAALLAPRYLAMLVEGAPAIADAIRIMASPSAFPLVFHSTLGKDRAGVLAAVLLAILGVHDEVIAEDYSLSALAADLVDVDEGARADDWPRPSNALLAAPAEAMVRVLSQIRDNGRSMVGYVRGIGVSSQVIESVRTNLLV
jgi:protein-tyrosine phosphatase